MTLAPPAMSLSAHAFAIVGLLPCVLHVLITSGRPFTPPFASSCATRIFAAASAGPSKGAMAPFASNAQPMTIGLPAVVRAAAVAARTSPATAIATSALRFTLFSSLDGSCRHPPFHPALDQLLPAPSDELGAVDVPERVRVCDAERSVVGEDLDVVEAVPAGAVERAEDGGRLEGRGPVQRAQDRVDAVARLVGAREERQGEDRRDRRDGGRRAEPALAEERDRLVVQAVAELHLPDADAVEAGGRVRAHVVREARGERAHLRDGNPRQTVRFTRHARGSCHSV